MEISRSITKRRKELRLSQNQLAEKLNVPETKVAQWESGKTLPEAALLPKICEALNIVTDDLVKDTSKENIMTGGKTKINRSEIAKYKIFVTLGFSLIIAGLLLTFVTLDTFVFTGIVISIIGSIACMFIGTSFYISFYKEQLYTKIYKRVLVKSLTFYVLFYLGLLCAISFRISLDITSFIVLAVCLVTIGILMPIVFEKHGYNLSFKNKLIFYICTGILWVLILVFTGLFFNAASFNTTHYAYYNIVSYVIPLIIAFVFILLFNYFFYGFKTNIKD